MRPHVHISAADLLIFALMYIVVAFILRAITVQWPDAPISKAIVYIHG